MVIVEYNKEWPMFFNKIKEELENNLNSFVKIEHVGSTAIKGMCAKPIIDIVIVVKDEDHFNQIKNELEIQFGYYHVGDWNVPGREVFKRKNSLHKMSNLEQSLLDKNIFKNNGNIKSDVLDTIEHNLYVCKIGAEELKRYILFRDYLNKNHEEMLKYYRLKQEIIKNYGNEDYNKYVKTKEENHSQFFEEIIKKTQTENSNE
jgi:GrpB-like predicted nucleotidyltransferase (UPF0157 family)